MFDYNNNSSSYKFNYNINAVSGTIRKSHPKSRIELFDMNDDIISHHKDGRCINTNYWGSTGWEREDAIVLQVMLCGNCKVMIEFVKKEDFNLEENLEDRNMDCL